MMFEGTGAALLSMRIALFFTKDENGKSDLKNEIYRMSKLEQGL